jgi:AmiR/NasT family two-component response regulator
MLREPKHLSPHGTVWSFTDGIGAQIAPTRQTKMPRMPGMNGLELLPKAKALRPDVPVIMITAYGDTETKRKALENGAEALLTKPIDFATLRCEIDMRVERPRERTFLG